MAIGAGDNPLISPATTTPADGDGPPAWRVNPSFAIGLPDARADLRRIALNRQPLERPLLVISGFLDPGSSAWYLWWRLNRLIRTNTADPFRIVRISLFRCLSLESCRRKILAVVRRISAGSETSSQVDVIGVSLGGLAARYAAMQRNDEIDRLRLRQLFTLSSPHTGADDADRYPPLHPMQRELRRESTLYDRVNAAPMDYALHAYVRLRDSEVGVHHAAPRGSIPWWVDTPRWQAAHSSAPRDPRILADIMRRLRHEPPLTIDPAAALPTSE